MSRESRNTWPATRAPGVVSCIRFRQRRSVDFPQPDGPMIAVTAPRGSSRLTSPTAWVAPYQADRSSIRTADSGLAVVPAGTGSVAGDDAGRRSIVRIIAHLGGSPGAGR